MDGRLVAVANPVGRDEPPPMGPSAGTVPRAAPPEQEAPRDAERQGRILVVDDEPAVRDVLHELLSAEGYQVETVADGAAGLARLLAGEIDLVLLDRMLPDVDGLKFCHLARQQQRGVYLPIVMLTALGAETEMVEGLDAGADDYIAKPFRQDELLARMRRLLRRHRRPARESRPSVGYA